MRSASGPVLSLSPTHNVYHSGYLISAVCASQGTLRVDPGLCPLVPVIHANGMSAAIDLFDSPKEYYLPALEACDLYLKRSYAPDFIPAGFSRKVAPFGLNYSCRTAAALWTVLSLTARRSLAPESLRPFLRSPSPSDFEVPASEPRDLRVLFQTRVWPKSGGRA